MGALRQGVNQDVLTRNTSGRNVDNGFWGVGEKQAREEADSFLPLLPSRKHTDPWGVMMFGEAALLCPGKNKLYL